jgi:hypothetical protein
MSVQSQGLPWPQVLSEIVLTDVEVLFDHGAPPTCGAAQATRPKL